MSQLISISHLNKSYGKNNVVSDINLSVRSGQILGLVGPNGAGKTTCLQAMLGLVDYEGDIDILGFNPKKQREKMLEQVAYIADVAVLPKWLKVKQSLEYLDGIHPRFSRDKAEELLAKTNIKLDSKVKHLSKGMVTQLHLALILAIDAKVLILDEPTTGLDPNQLVEIRELIKELGKDKTVLLSTHIMQEVEAMCHRVIIINKGELVIDKPISELKTSNEQVLKVTFDYKLEEQFIKRLPNLTSYKNTVENNWTLVFKAVDDMRPVIFDFAQENGLKILGLNAENKNLESLFRELTS